MLVERGELDCSCQISIYHLQLSPCSVQIPVRASQHHNNKNKYFTDSFYPIITGMQGAVAGMFLLLSRSNSFHWSTWRNFSMRYQRRIRFRTRSWDNTLYLQWLNPSHGNSRQLNIPKWSFMEHLANTYTDLVLMWQADGQQSEEADDKKHHCHQIKSLETFSSQLWHSFGIQSFKIAAMTYKYKKGFLKLQ